MMNEEGETLKKELFDAAIESGRNALKSGMIINGAASLSMLTFIGSISSGPNAKIIIKSLSFPLGCFVFGVLSCAVAAGATYFAQTFFYCNPNKIYGRCWNYLGVLLVIISYISFAFGSFKAYYAFLSWP